MLLSPQITQYICGHVSKLSSEQRHLKNEGYVDLVEIMGSSVLTMDIQFCLVLA